MESLRAKPDMNLLQKVISLNDPNLIYINDHNIETIRYQFKVVELPNFKATIETLGATTLNEDCFIDKRLDANKHLFAVLDGASSQQKIAGLEKYGLSGAFFVSHLLGLGFGEDEFTEMTRKGLDNSAGDIMRFMNSWIHEKSIKVEGINFSDPLTIPGMAASFVVLDFDKKKLNLAHVADTVVALRHKDGTIKVISQDQNQKFDKETDEVRKKLCTEYHCTPREIKTIPEAGAKYKKHLAESYRSKINTPEGCGILNGMPELVTNELIYETNADLENVREVVMTSDGVLLPFCLTECTTEEKVANYLSLRPFGEPSLAIGAAILEDDHDCIKMPRGKVRDDATAIRIKLS